MSSENVEVVLELLSRFTANEPMDDLIDDDALMTAPDGWPEGGPFRGREAILRQLDRLREDFSDHRFTNVEVIAEDEDWAVVQYRWHTRGSASGVETSFDAAVAMKSKDKRFAEGHFRWNSDEALETAGLSR